MSKHTTRVILKHLNPVAIPILVHPQIFYEGLIMFFHNDILVLRLAEVKFSVSERKVLNCRIQNFHGNWTMGFLIVTVPNG